MFFNSAFDSFCGRKYGFAIGVVVAVLSRLIIVFVVASLSRAFLFRRVDNKVRKSIRKGIKLDKILMPLMFQVSFLPSVMLPIVCGFSGAALDAETFATVAVGFLPEVVPNIVWGASATPFVADLPCYLWLPWLLLRALLAFVVLDRHYEYLNCFKEATPIKTPRQPPKLHSGLTIQVRRLY